MDPELLKGYFAAKKNDYSRIEFDFFPSGRDPTQRVKLGATFEGLNTLTKFRAKDIEQLLALLILRGSINPDNLEGTVVDFGMGHGPGAYILNRYGGSVTGVDSVESFVHIAINEGILPTDRAVFGDGFTYLQSLAPESLDFIAAFMMPRGFPHGRLYQASQRALKTGGQLLITGGLLELKDELLTTVGPYGKVEDVITVHDDGTFGNVAFTYTHR